MHPHPVHLDKYFNFTTFLKVSVRKYLRTRDTEYLNSMSKTGLDEAFQGIKSSFQPDYMFLKTLNLGFTRSGIGF